MALSQDYLKKLRGVGHELKPMIQLGQKGLTPSVIEEIDRALTDHELIKVKLSGVDKTTKAEFKQQIETQTQSQVVHAVGHMILLYKPNPEAKPKLSNLKRFGL